MQPDEKTALFDEIILDMIGDAHRLLQFIQEVNNGTSYGVRVTHTEMWQRLERIRYQSEMLNQRIKLAQQANP
jgi:hypothetical protein